jgi:hypothetical protein
MPDNDPDIEIGAKFSVAAVSRHPRLGIDYDSRRHTFKDNYINPKSYSIAITDFPGKKFYKPAVRVISGSGSNPMRTASWWLLTDCIGVSGWSFVVTGEPFGALGNVGRPFKVQHFKGLPTPVGQFDDEGPNNAWNWVAEVPGSGKYILTASAPTHHLPQCLHPQAAADPYPGCGALQCVEREGHPRRRHQS